MATQDAFQKIHLTRAALHLVAWRDDRPSAARALRELEKDAPSPKRRRVGPTIPEPKRSAPKSSRGRKVPSVSTRNGGLAASNSGESLSASRGGTSRGRGGGSAGSGKRQFRCTAEGCGKLFVRKEHLKRHVKSLHTEDKREWLPLGSVRWEMLMASCSFSARVPLSALREEV